MGKFRDMGVPAQVVKKNPAQFRDMGVPAQVVKKNPAQTVLKFDLELYELAGKKNLLSPV
jgi:hypothetical protein